MESHTNADIKQIMSILPHRPPFLLIDRIIECQPGVRAVAEKYVTMNEPFFVGHFPGEPVMPGVLIIEALAQTGAYCVLSMAENAGKLAYFAGVDKARFRLKVTPGCVLRLEAEMVKIKAGAGIGKAVAYLGDKKACDAEFTFMFG